MTYIKPINFLRMYKVGEYIYGDMFLLRYEENNVKTLLDKLVKEEKLEECAYFQCPKCYHKTKFISKEELEEWNDETSHCPYCGEELKREGKRPAYKVLKRVSEENEPNKGSNRGQKNTSKKPN